MIVTMEKAERNSALGVAELMMSAARTAPKGSGKDKVITMTLTDEDKDLLAENMDLLGDEYDEAFIHRDAQNVRDSICVVIIGVGQEPFGLDNCSNCGFKNCAEMIKAGANCAFNITDLGIAVGSAVSVCADHRIDNRVMYSAGKGALKMGIIPENVRVCYGIPLFVGAKSIYFDRGPGAVLR